MDRLDVRASRDRQASLALRVPLGLRAGQDQRVRGVHKVYKVIAASLETLEVLASLDLLACLEIEDTLEQLEQLVLRDVLVLQDCLELLDRVLLDLLVHQDLLELQDTLDLLVHEDRKDFEVPMVTLDLLAT